MTCHHLSILLAIAVCLCLQLPLQTLAFSASSYSPFDLLAADQYGAQSRRSEVEQGFLEPDGRVPVELLEADWKKKSKADRSSSGGGFGGTGGGSKWSKNKVLAKQQKQCLLDTGVVRINQALSPESCSALREYVMEEIKDTAALFEGENDNNHQYNVEDYYGIEPGRTCRTDLLLSLTAPAVSVALEELFHVNTGKLRDLYKSLVTTDGILYEMASVVTSNGSERQCIHPDVPFQADPPLYVVFLALQDVTPAMGPTTFLRASHTQAANRAFDVKGSPFDEYLQRDADPVEALLQAGDCVVFDARVLHCGNANIGGNDRALFNFSFRNPKVTGDFGYKGSMRPGYTRQNINLGNVLDAVDGKSTSFAHYGNGLHLTSQEGA